MARSVLESGLGCSSGDASSETKLQMIETIRSGWSRLPFQFRELVRKTGVLYAANYLASYAELHRRDRFAGNLARSENEIDDGILNPVASFEDILESLVLANGVRKTTAPGRQLNILNHFLGRPERPISGVKIRVLDLPCSSGVGSIDSHNLLSNHYQITSYVLADICLELKYDRKCNAVYDSTGELLQVQGEKYFFGIHRAHMSGATHTLLSDLLLWPLSLRARQLKRKYAIHSHQPLDTIRLLHPKTRRQVEAGKFTVQNADIFSQRWEEEFDLVLSFNLLQKNYFPPSKISEGLQNLNRALSEGGYLVTGNTESFGVMRKTKGVLVTQYQHGEW